MILRGKQFHLHAPFRGLPDYVSQEIERTGDYFGGALMRERLGPAKGSVRTFVDCGAHIGSVSRFALEELGAKKVIAFEPWKPNFEVLEKNLPGQELHMVGLSDKEGESGISVAAAPGVHVNTGMAQLSEGTGIPLRTLDSFELPPFELMKVDVEGHEPELFAGAVGTLREYKPAIWCEHNTVDAFRRSWEILAPLGYEMVGIWSDGSNNALWRAS